MSKEYLEAFKTIKIKCHPNSNPSPLVDKALEIVEQALQRLEAIDNAKPSEALECFEEIENYGEWSEFNTSLSHDFPKEYNTIKNYMLKAQDQEKLLIAKKNGFFDGYGMWRDEDFVIDYDTIRKEFYLRSITVGYGLGNTRFYESDYKKTWWLNKNKEE